MIHFRIIVVHLVHRHCCIIFSNNFRIHHLIHIHGLVTHVHAHILHVAVHFHHIVHHLHSFKIFEFWQWMMEFTDAFSNINRC